MKDGAGNVKSVLVTGGVNPTTGQYFKTTELLQINEGNWNYGPDLLVKVGWHSILSSNDKNFSAYVMGGYNSSGLYSKQISGLNRNTNQWEEIGNLVNPRRFHTATYAPLDSIYDC